MVAAATYRKTPIRPQKPRPMPPGGSLSVSGVRPGTSDATPQPTSSTPDGDAQRELEPQDRLALPVVERQARQEGEHRGDHQADRVGQVEADRGAGQDDRPGCSARGG